MSDLENSPELMTRICNIQMMNEAINPTYDKIADFEILKELTAQELWDRMVELIPKYNAIKNK